MGGAQASVRERGEKRGTSEAGPGAGLLPPRRLLGRPTREKGRGRGRVERAAAGQKWRGREIEPVRFLSISISFSFFRPSYALFKLVFEFKLEMQICNEDHHMSSKSSKHSHTRFHTSSFIFMLIYLYYMSPRLVIYFSSM